MHTVILGSALLRGMCLINGSSQKKVLSVNRSRIMQSTVSCLMAHTMLSDIMAYYLNALVLCVWSVRNLSTSYNSCSLLPIQKYVCVCDDYK